MWPNPVFFVVFSASQSIPTKIYPIKTLKTKKTFLFDTNPPTNKNQKKNKQPFFQSLPMDPEKLSNIKTSIPSEKDEQISRDLWRSSSVPKPQIFFGGKRPKNMVGVLGKQENCNLAKMEYHESTSKILVGNLFR